MNDSAVGALVGGYCRHQRRNVRRLRESSKLFFFYEFSHPNFKITLLRLSIIYFVGHHVLQLYFGPLCVSTSVWSKGAACILARSQTRRLAAAPSARALAGVSSVPARRRLGLRAACVTTGPAGTTLWRRGNGDGDGGGRVRG